MSKHDAAGTRLSPRSSSKRAAACGRSRRLLGIKRGRTPLPCWGGVGFGLEAGSGARGGGEGDRWGGVAFVLQPDSAARERGKANRCRDLNQQCWAPDAAGRKSRTA